MLDPSKNPYFSNRITDSYTLYNNGVQQPQFRTHWNDMGDILAERKLIDDDEDSGVCSPPIWRTTSPPRSPQNHYRSLSPSSRAQAIARGQRELMEMVSRMPEGCYELSLKDIVEQNIVDQQKEKERQECSNQQRSIEENIIRGSEKKNKKVQINRSSSIDNSNRDGFLLKMVFPISLGSKKKKKKKSNLSAGNNSGRDGRVSPKPLLCDGSATKSNVVDEEWWKNRYAEETGDTESNGLSSNSGSSKSSGSSSSRSSSRNGSTRIGRGGCWSCFFKKRENKEE